MLRKREGNGKHKLLIEYRVEQHAGVSIFCGIGERCRDGEELYREMREAVEEEFMHLDEQEQKVRSVLAKMESGFMHRLVDGTTSILTQGAGKSVHF